MAREVGLSVGAVGVLWELLNAQPEVWLVLKAQVEGLRAREVSNAVGAEDLHKILRAQGAIRVLDEYVGMVGGLGRRIVMLTKGEENE